MCLNVTSTPNSACEVVSSTNVACLPSLNSVVREVPKVLDMNSKPLEGFEVSKKSGNPLNYPKYPEHLKYIKNQKFILLQKCVDTLKFLRVYLLLQDRYLERLKAVIEQSHEFKKPKQTQSGITTHMSKLQIFLKFHQTWLSGLAYYY